VVLDSGTAPLTLSLDDYQSWEIPRTDTGGWREHVVPVERFPAASPGSNIEIVVRSHSAETVLHMVEIIRSESP
jgi:hypothetical protein